MRRATGRADRTRHEPIGHEATGHEAIDREHTGHEPTGRGDDRGIAGHEPPGAGITGRQVAEVAVVFAVLALTVVVVLLMRRPGHWWGDDWALYVRQAESIFSGGTARVVADNEFTVAVTGPPEFSPPMYPWGFPLLLAPFVAVLGTDLDRLVIAQAVFFCWFLTMWYRLARPRTGTGLALGGLLVLAMSPQYVRWTELIQSEIAFIAVVMTALVVLDLPATRRALVAAGGPLWPLVAVGIAAAGAFTVRREGLATVAAIGVAQVGALAVWWRGADPDVRARLLGRGSDGAGWSRARLVPAARLVARLALPYVAVGATIGIVQVLLPSTLVPRYRGNGLHNVPRYASDHLGNIVESIGLKNVYADGPTLLGSSGAGAVAVAVFVVLVVVGLGIAAWRRPHLDLPLAAFMVGALAIGGSFRVPGNRYVAAIGPVALVFALIGLRALARRVPAVRLPARMRSSLRPGMIAAVALVVLLASANAWRVAGLVSDAREFERRGFVEWGPDHPDAVEMFEAVERLTDPDDVIGFFKARAMTLRTDRRATQVDEHRPLERTIDIITHLVIDTSAPYRPDHTPHTNATPIDATDATDATPTDATDATPIDATLTELWSNPRFTLYAVTTAHVEGF